MRDGGEFAVLGGVALRGGAGAVAGRGVGRTVRGRVGRGVGRLDGGRGLYGFGGQQVQQVRDDGRSDGRPGADTEPDAPGN